jgi:hypothetical protein
MDSLNNRFKKYFKNKNFVIFYYLLGSTSIYILCEIIKNINFINYDKNNKIKYNHCVNILKKDIVLKDTVKICEILENKENFQNFTYNLFYTWLIIYILIRETINNNIYCLKYWILAHISSIIYTYTGHFELLRFSYNNKDSYSFYRKLIIALSLLVLCIPTIINIYLKKLNFSITLKFISIYLILYFLLLTVTTNITIHIHHCIFSGFFYLLFSDFNLKLNYYLHSILLGIIIQGINFYSLSELMLFYIPDTEPPSINYLIILYSLFLSSILVFKFIIKCFYKNKINENDYEKLNIQLIPSMKELDDFNNSI